VSGEGAPFSRPRHTLETAAIVVPTLGVALLFPSSAEKIFAITGGALPCRSAGCVSELCLRF